jgi:hypothetical protein
VAFWRNSTYSSIFFTGLGSSFLAWLLVVGLIISSLRSSYVVVSSILSLCRVNTPCSSIVLLRTASLCSLYCALRLHVRCAHYWLSLIYRSLSMSTIRASSHVSMYVHSLCIVSALVTLFLVHTLLFNTRCTHVGY